MWLPKSADLRLDIHKRNKEIGNTGSCMEGARLVQQFDTLGCGADLCGRAVGLSYLLFAFMYVNARVCLGLNKRSVG